VKVLEQDASRVYRQLLVGGQWSVASGWWWFENGNFKRSSFNSSFIVATCPASSKILPSLYRSIVIVGKKYAFDRHIERLTCRDPANIPAPVSYNYTENDCTFYKKSVPKPSIQ
jgi:hypothetical protein